MSIDVEYAIKKDIRNNPVVRGVDARERREIRRMVWLASVSLAMVLFSAWQHSRMVLEGYSLERLRSARSYEATVNRQLRLNVETLKAPQDVERRARALGLEPPTSKNTIVLERDSSAARDRGLVARDGAGAPVVAQAR